jgi:hypothetical protein
MGGAKDNEDEGKIALITFSGMCYNCNQSGHRVFECPQKKKQGNNGGGNGSNGGNHNNNNNNKKTIACSICNKKGHGDSNCWLKPGNEDKKPQWLKNKEQVSAATGRSTAPELLLCGLTLPNSQKILDDPNVWIGDTAATTHSTPHTLLGRYDMRKSTAKDSVTMVNGKSESASSI